MIQNVFDESKRACLLAFLLRMGYNDKTQRGEE